MISMLQEKKLINKKWLLVILPCLAVFSAFRFCPNNSKISSLFYEDVEALSSCEATFPNSSGTIVTIQCAGESGTCQIKRTEKVNTKYGTFTVYVDATCSGQPLR